MAQPGKFGLLEGSYPLQNERLWWIKDLEKEPTRDGKVEGNNEETQARAESHALTKTQISTRHEGSTITTLCDKCWYIFDHVHELPYDRIINQYDASYCFPYYHRLSSVRIQAGIGCLLCRQFIRSVDLWAVGHEGQFEYNIRRGYMSILSSNQSSSRCWRLWIDVEGGLRYRRFSSWIDLEKSSYPLPDALFGCNLENAIQLSKLWLQSCSVHQNCYSAQKGHLPTRLICIGDDNSRIILSETLVGAPPYATLSHCWGSMKATTLRKGNLAAFMNEIPTEALPLTFCDAIDFARGMGIVYLWIDSLCIVQDDDLDWATESSKMASVYGKSFLNIAATSASNSSQGLFCRRNELPSLAFPIRAKNINPSSRYISMAEDMFKITYQTISPLLKRGWVLQERILAPRSLHFTDEMIFWECNEGDLSGAFPYKKPSHMVHEYFSMSRKTPLLQRTWGDIVNQYTSCDLTFDSDRLVALSGIARKMQGKQNSQYCAGLWANTLNEQLDWGIVAYQVTKKVPRRLNHSPHSDKFVGPTWSWISMKAPVYLPLIRSNGGQLHFTVEEVTITPKGSDTYGSLSAAILYLNCENLHIVEISAFENWGDMTLEGKVAIGGKSFRISATLDEEMDQNKVEKTKTVCMALLRSRRRTFSGLLLESTGTEFGEYVRLGLFTWYPEEGDHGMLESARDPPPEYSYQSITHELGKIPTYKISII